MDKWGLRWQIVPASLGRMMREGTPAQSRRVTDAMMQMIKLDVAVLEKAFRER